MIPARLLEDCARNLRIAYQLSVPINVAVLEAAGAGHVTVNRFSDFSPGAADHITATFTLNPPVRAEGILGGYELVVTYGSLSGRANPDTVAELERRLMTAVARHQPFPVGPS